MESDVYSIVRLSEDKPSIRILDLLPGPRDSPIKCTLRCIVLTQDFNAYPRYEALSYTWGASTEGRSVCVNKEFDIPVTDNLFRALRALRYQYGKKRTLWIDALCINQSDLAEENNQIPHMGTIYFRAQLVNIWLGDPGPTNIHRGLLRRLEKLILFGLLHSRRDRLDVPLDRYGKSKLRRLRLTWSVVQNDAHRIAKALECATCKWHRRGWVVQEIVLSRKAYVCLGKRRVLFSQQRLFDLSIERARNANRNVEPNFLDFAVEAASRFGEVQNLWDFNHRDMDYLAFGLEDFAHLTAGAETTDPRDKVYSLLALLPQAEVAVIGPDYDDSCADVFLKATFASFQFSQTYSILRLRSLRDSKIPGLPSWAVDFTEIVDCSSIPLYNQFTEAPWSPDGLVPTLQSCGKLLTINAALCDTVASTLRINTTTVSRTEIVNHMTARVEAALSRMRRFLQERQPHEASDILGGRKRLVHQILELIFRLNVQPVIANTGDRLDDDELESTAWLKPAFDLWDDSLRAENS